MQRSADRAGLANSSAPRPWRGTPVAPLSYDTLRAVVRRANTVLGTNWTMHDLRHTCAQRMSRDRHLTLRDVQVILGHAHLSTTADIYLVEDQHRTIERVAEHLTRDRTATVAASAPPSTAQAYDAGDMQILFGKASL